MPRKTHPVTGKMMHLVRTRDAGLTDAEWSWFDGGGYYPATDDEIERFVPDREATLA